jgi:hypothetical protein
MGKRDKRGREPRKPKKDSKKAIITEIIPSPLTVEVIKKGKREQPDEE